MQMSGALCLDSAQRSGHGLVCLENYLITLGGKDVISLLLKFKPSFQIPFTLRVSLCGSNLFELKDENDNGQKYVFEQP